MLKMLFNYENAKSPLKAIFLYNGIRVTALVFNGIYRFVCAPENQETIDKSAPEIAAKFKALISA